MPPGLRDAAQRGAWLGPAAARALPAVPAPRSTRQPSLGPAPGPQLASRNFAPDRRPLAALPRRARTVAAAVDQREPGRAGGATQTEPAGPSGREPEPPQPGGSPPFGLIAALAAAGASITGYLAWEKFTGGPVVCPASGSCETVLSSGYASIFGVPLSLLGFLAYAAVAGLASWQAAAGRSQQPNAGRLAVLGGGTVLAATSSSLLYLLATQFPGQSCTWCLTSAALSFAIFAAACSGFKPNRELAELAAPGGLTASGVILFLAFAWSGVEPPMAQADISIPYQATQVQTRSSPRAVGLAVRLRDAGAKMYGAFWCSHCQEQKIAFGAEAQSDLPYIECFPDGYRTGVQMAEECRAAQLPGFPLWVINGQRYEGEQSFSQLESALTKTAPS